ncbi:MFS transporter [Alishewanella longhuensis]
MIFIGLSGLFLGQLADRLGRKKIILFGLLLYTLACVAFAISRALCFIYCCWDYAG